MCDFDDFDGIGVDDWLIIGPLSEQLSEEKREREKLYRDMSEDDDGVIFDKD